MVRRILLCLLLLMALGRQVSAQASVDPEAVKSVAVTPFASAMLGEDAWLGKAIADLLARKLATIRGYVLLERTHLQSFLDEQDVQFFERAAPNYPDAVRMTLLVSKEKAVDKYDLRKLTEQGGVIVFRETHQGVPLVKSETMGSHRLITVKLPLVSSLATDPYAQELLLEIVRLSQGKEP